MPLPVLVGDTGGTNTRLALVNPATGTLEAITSFRNEEFTSYEAAVVAYLHRQGIPRVSASVLAFAAPITDDSVALTNHSWTVTKSALQAAAGGTCPVFLNDLEALAWSLDLLPSDGVQAIGATAVPANTAGGRLVIGIGTGFNAAVLEGGLLPGHGSPAVRVAECGHMTLPVETAEELSLRDYLAQGRGRASIERALSGLGMVEVHSWACIQLGQEPSNLSGAEITRRGLEGSDPACTMACTLVTRLTARIAGDLALAYLPFGGIYLAGSVTQALLPMIRAPQFRTIFTAKGRQSSLLDSFPIHIISDGTAALFGCAAFAFNQTSIAGPLK